jgi:TPP-dependent 2-oxoacid decarboxylase
MLNVVNTCDEQGAAFAADAYARVRGFGAVCITYCVGGLKVVNPTAQAYAEKSPVAVISGAPGTKERTKNPLLHHMVRDYDTQQKIFEHITVASTVLNNPNTVHPKLIVSYLQGSGISGPCISSYLATWCLYLYSVSRRK